MVKGIYKIISPSNKIYVGQSWNIEKRFKKYKNLDISTKNQPKLWNSLLKYSPTKHIFEIIEKCEIEKLNEKERYWQDYYDVLGKNGLNCILQECKNKPRKISEETRKKYSDWQKGDNSPKGFKDKKHSQKTKDIISKKNKNKLVSKETKEKMSLWQKGRKLTESHRNNMRGKRKSINGKKVINAVTKEVFDSIAIAAKFFNLNEGTLRARLSGRLKNNTDLQYFTHLKTQIKENGTNNFN